MGAGDGTLMIRQDKTGGCTPLTPAPAGLLEGMNRVVAPVLEEWTLCL